MDTFGTRLKRIRLLKELKQEDFANLLGLTKQSVSNIENDKTFVSKEVLGKLVLDLKINLNYLIAGKGQMFLADDNTSATSKSEIALEVEKILKEKGLIL